MLALAMSCKHILNAKQIHIAPLHCMRHSTLCHICPMF